MLSNNRDRITIVGQPTTLTEAIALMRPHLQADKPVFLQFVEEHSIDRGRHTKFRVDVRRDTVRAKKLVPGGASIRLYGQAIEGQLAKLRKAFPGVEIQHRDAARQQSPTPAAIATE